MTGNDGERERLGADDARLVQRIGELYRAPELDPARRARFDARLQQRIARAPRWRALVAAAAAAAALLLLVRATLPSGTQPQAKAAGEAEPAGVALLALLEDEPLAADESLPDDYAALASLLE